MSYSASLLQRILATGLLLMAPALTSHASLWPEELTPGPHAVGFRTIERYDFTRVYAPKLDYLGQPLSGERARPLQVCVWYPAQSGAGGMEMVCGEYLFSYPADIVFLPHLTQLQERELYYLRYLTANRTALIMDLVNTPAFARRDPPAAAGRFPLLLYAPEARRGALENAVLCEYLASYGFVVATTPTLGTTVLNPERGARDLETLVRDQEFMIAVTRELPFVDPDKLAAFGCGFGGLVSLLFQMRSTDVQAVAALDGAFVYREMVELVRGNPYFDIQAMTVPLLLIHPADQASLDMSIVNELRYALRCTVALDEVTHADFTVYREQIGGAAEAADSLDTMRGSAYGGICVYLRDFLREHLSAAEAVAARRFGYYPAEMVAVTLQEAAELPPTETQFIGIVRSAGIERALAIYRHFKETDPEHTIFREAVLNGLGYEFLARNRVDEAIGILSLNSEAYPQSANTWDSLSEALLAGGENERAIECLRKLLAVLPADPAPDERLRDILRTNAEERLARLTEPTQ